jgi:hypothetical protein
VAANNRTAGTADENKAVVGGSIALFGTHAVDDDKKLVIFTVKASTFPQLGRSCAAAQDRSAQ